METPYSSLDTLKMLILLGTAKLPLARLARMDVFS